MWFEEINKKIQEAEESNNPAFNDKAWENMQLLLDKHLPLKKKRRKFLFILVPILLTGTTVFFILQKGGNKNEPLIEQKSIPVQSSASADRLPVNPVNPQAPSPGSSTQLNPVGTTIENQASETKWQDHHPPEIRHSYSKKIKQGLSRKEYKQSQSFLEKKAVKKTEDLSANIISNKPPDSNKPPSVDNITANKTINPVPIDSLAVQDAVVNSDTIENTTQTETGKIPIKEEKKKISAVNKLSLNLSFGPDISSVGFDKSGQIEMQYGIGFGYALSKRLSIRTGFFSGYKKYTADSADYHSPYSINNLQKVDANCLVYEIPLTLVYNFAATKKYNWFISGGLSSYIMKKETYEYYYKNSWGQPQYYNHTYTNENSHLFSIINISGGYQYHFTDRFSIMAEPYIKIPASGIGVGKVKLNSAGILFTIGFKPFLKEK